MTSIIKSFVLTLALFFILLTQSVHAYYDPSSGRFLSFDPVAPPAGSMDGYSYCNGDPCNGLDPTGRCLSSFKGGESTPYAGPAGIGMAGLGAIPTLNIPDAPITYTDGAIGNANKFYDQQFSLGLGNFLQNGSVMGLGQALTSFAGSTIIAASPVNGGVEQSWQNAGAAWGEGRYTASIGNGLMGTLPTALTVLPIIGGEFSAVVPKALPESGFIDASMVRFSQSSISSTFKSGVSISDVAAQLRGPAGTELAAQFPPIRLVSQDGLLYTLDNRRLAAFSAGNQALPYRMATEAEIAAEQFKFTTTAEQGWGQFITVRPPLKQP